MSASERLAGLGRFKIRGEEGNLNAWQKTLNRHSLKPQVVSKNAYRAISNALELQPLLEVESSRQHLYPRLKIS